LVSERPYKKAWSQDEAKAEIQRQAGAHFDPELTRLFLELLG
jgi:HD-GYP domain-containing protein (c-di-GMP phosphodiesterase class II)